MRRLKRVLHAFGRYRHGRGFGVHSPFAFRFILRTLRERTPFYAYETLSGFRKEIKKSVRVRRHMMSEKHMRMLFRIVNLFEPACVLELGSLSGEDIVAIMETSSTLRLNIYAPIVSLPFSVTERYATRIEERASLPVSLDTSFVVVADLDDSYLPHAEDLLLGTLGRLSGKDMILVFPDIRTDGIRRLWNDVRSAMPYGMTFYNEGSFAVAVVRSKLPRQDFRVSL
ncbi:MAG: hypothetical protein K2O12_00915 [Muribaculaceae bacterium]|nr:hypothetical protein [Muribaculaceae bacterium]